MKWCVICFLLLTGIANAQIISTFAGNGSGIYSGNGVPATTAGIPDPAGGVFDKYGNYYFADVISSDRIRKIDTAGIITTVAGGGSGSFADGVPATATVLFEPLAVRLDTFGNLYIADAGTNNSRIRKVNATTGIITTIAGIGTSGFSGDGGPASAATIQGAEDICFDKWGNLYIADLGNHRVRKVDTTGIITTFAGATGVSPIGDGGPATDAEINAPTGLAADDTGNIYIADESTNRVRKVNMAGIITTVAGNGTYNYIGDGIPATSAQIGPVKLAFDYSGQLFIADNTNRRVFYIDHSDILHLVAGNGDTGYNANGIQATAASVDDPTGVSFDACGNLYIPDGNNRRICKVDLNPACWPESVQKISTTHTINIYPNPAYNSLTITTTDKINSVTIYNFIGQSVYYHTYNTAKAEVNIAALPEGMYMVEVITSPLERPGEAGRRTVNKIVKQ